MKAILSIFLIVLSSSHQKSMPIEMNSHFWYAIGMHCCITTTDIFNYCTCQTRKILST